MAEEKNIALLALTLLSAAMLTACSSKLDKIDKEGFLYIYEIEKLARNVYKNFYDKWGISIMNEISKSEQSHMNVIKKLANSYGVDLPEDNDYEEFTNSQLQQLYYDLIEEGSASDVNAITIAAMVEEIDITDIKKYWEQTEKEDVDNTYKGLTEGSYIHLQAFATLLKDKGLEYQPNYLSQQDYNQIISHSSENTDVEEPGLLWICPQCGYIYDPEIEGRPFEEVRGGYACPNCQTSGYEFFSSFW